MLRGWTTHKNGLNSENCKHLSLPTIASCRYVCLLGSQPYSQNSFQKLLLKLIALSILRRNNKRVMLHDYLGIVKEKTIVQRALMVTTEWLSMDLDCDLIYTKTQHRNSIPIHRTKTCSFYITNLRQRNISNLRRYNRRK